MKKIVSFLFCIIPLFAFAGEDWTWWNIKHGWQPGMPSWRSFIHITPGYLGPNALPVPEVKKGTVPAGNSFEFGVSAHFREGDPTQNLFGKYYRSYAEGKVAIEVFGMIAEHYAMSEFVRDERVARDFDGKGIANGDLYFSTLIQLIKGRKFPDAMVRMAVKTASGNRLEGARHTDSPGYYFDFSFSRTYCGSGRKMIFLPYASFGFYSWQTNDDMNLQNDAYMYGLGADLQWTNWTVSNSLAGYSGYKKERDRPMVYTFDVNRRINNYTLRLQYLHGLRDWTYQTVKLSLILDLKKPARK